VSYRIRTRVRAHRFAGRVEDFECDGLAGVAREEVIDDRAGRRVFARWPLGRPRRWIVHAETDAHSRSRLDEIRRAVGCSLPDGRRLSERRDAVEDPIAASMGSRDQIRAEARRVVFYL